MPAYIVGEIHVTDPAAYRDHVPRALATIARFGGASSPAAAGSICWKAIRYPNKFSSSNFQQPMWRDDGIGPRTTRRR